MRILLSALALIILSTLPSTAQAAETKTALFAGGCFWCMESEFQDLKGVSDVISGYAGGEGPAPTYEQVSSGRTGFKESVSITYDPDVVSYQRLLDIFWRNVDPFDDKGQFCDKGSQYVAAIFYASPEEEALARASLKKVEDKFGQKVATQIIPATTFYPAEDYHQDYFEKSSTRYKLYRNGCGRDRTLEKIWGNEESLAE